MHVTSSLPSSHQPAHPHKPVFIAARLWSCFQHPRGSAVGHALSSHEPGTHRGSKRIPRPQAGPAGNRPVTPRGIMGYFESADRFLDLAALPQCPLVHSETGRRFYDGRHNGRGVVSLHPMALKIGRWVHRRMSIFQNPRQKMDRLCLFPLHVTHYFSFDYVPVIPACLNVAIVRHSRPPCHVPSVDFTFIVCRLFPLSTFRRSCLLYKWLSFCAWISNLLHVWTLNPTWWLADIPSPESVQLNHVRLFPNWGW